MMARGRSVLIEFIFSLLWFKTAQGLVGGEHAPGKASGTKKTKHGQLHPLSRVKELTNYTREWLSDNLEQHFTRESGPEMAKKWQSRFIHSEKRIKKHFQRFLCDWENIEPPHGKKALNTQAKRDLAIGGYDKYPPLVGLAQITHGWRNLLSIYLRQCRGERHEEYEFSRIKEWFEELSQKYIDRTEL